jgi:hypothetical protein
MFRTYAAAEVSVPACEDDPATTISTFVEVMGQLLWFIGTLSDVRAEGHVLRTFLVRDLDELKTIARNRGRDIIQVDIAVPPSDSQTGEWEFERLVAAWDCEDRRYADGVARVYESIQGISYTNVVPEIEPFDPTALRRLRRVYPTSKVRYSQWSRLRGRAQDDVGGTDGS